MFGNYKKMMFDVVRSREEGFSQHLERASFAVGNLVEQKVAVVVGPVEVKSVVTEGLYDALQFYFSSIFSASHSALHAKNEDLED